MRIHLIAAAALLSLAAGAAGAQAMKPGLWEINNKMGGGEMDAAMAEMRKQLADMPPDQRKQMEAMMAQQGLRMAPGAGGGMAMQVCMTKEMAERNDMPMQEGCRTTKSQRSGKNMTFAFTCSNPPSSGEGQVSFPSPESYTSHMKLRTTAQGRTETTTMDATGKWLKADCGNVRPIGGPRR
jgi:hypothetical protein